MGPPDFGRIQNRHCRFSAGRLTAENPAKLVLFIRCGVVRRRATPYFFAQKASAVDAKTLAITSMKNMAALRSEENKKKLAFVSSLW